MGGVRTVFGNTEKCKMKNSNSHLHHNTNALWFLFLQALVSRCVLILYHNIQIVFLWIPDFST